MQKKLTPQEKMFNLISSLPIKDIKLGYKYLTARDFTSLKSLVDSALYKIEKNLYSENPKSEYLSLNVDKINELQSEIDSYLDILGFDDEYDDYDDCDNY